jgi:hypothetical protein
VGEESTALLPDMKQYFVYIMSNKSRPGFTARYQFDMLVHYEVYSQVASAIAREKEIKGWRREKKLKLILADNPDWADLSMEWEEDPSWKAISEKELRPLPKRKPLEP